MKSYIAFFLFSLVLVSCAPFNSNIGIPQVYQYPQQLKSKPFLLSELMKVPVQHFTITSYNDTILRGIEGTEITLKPSCMLSNDQEQAVLPFDIVLKELYTKSALLKERACTVSNGAMLESDGSLYIHAVTANGESLTISCDDALLISIPKMTQEGMQYFEGNRDATGNLNWNLTDSIIPVVPDGQGFFGDAEENWEEISAQSETFRAAEHYFFSVKKFGYINCDRFYEDSTEKTSLMARTVLPEKGKLFESYTYIVFDSLLSIMPVYQDEDGYWTSTDLPLGAPVTFISIQKQGDLLYYGSVKTEIGSSPLLVPLHQINTGELQKILDLSL